MAAGTANVNPIWSAYPVFGAGASSNVWLTLAGAVDGSTNTQTILTGSSDGNWIGSIVAIANPSGNNVQTVARFFATISSVRYTLGDLQLPATTGSLNSIIISPVFALNEGFPANTTITVALLTAVASGWAFRTKNAGRY
jgi:hypothetical protein